MHDHEDVERTLADVRVALIAANFSPEIGYQEVDLAAAFAHLGAEVVVVTTTRPSRNAREVVPNDYPAGTTNVHGHTVIRVEPRAVIGTNVLGCRVRPVVDRIGPSHVVLVGPGKLFGLDLFADDSAPWSRVAVVQDNSDDGRSEGPAARRLARALVHRAVKRRAYRRVVRRADRIVLNVPETREIISAWLTERERRRLAMTGVELRLGFDPRKFFFDEEARRRWRDRHAIAEDDVVLVTCTRASPGKGLEHVIDCVSATRAGGSRIRYVLAGIGDDAYGRTLRLTAASQPEPDAFLLLPMLEHDEMRELFSASDFGFWPRAAITIQQAMGTGLQILLRRRPNVSHLLVEGRNGWYLRSDESLEAALASAAAVRVDPREPAQSRLDRAAFARTYLGYDAIALEMLQGLGRASEPSAGRRVPDYDQPTR